MKHFILFIAATYSLACSNAALAQNHPVIGASVSVKSFSPKIQSVKIEDFIITPFVTVGEYKTYLKAVKKDSSAAFYKSQLPQSMVINEELVSELLADTKLQNQPMPGISWQAAKNYCHWLSKKESTTIAYDLPWLSELLAFEQQYPSDKTSILSSWTLNSIDESLKEVGKVFDYQNKIDEHNTSRALKRRVIYGESYHQKFRYESKDYNVPYEYQDSCSRFVGFRMVQRLADEPAFKTTTKNDRLLNGIYSEYYENGKIKVLGQFKQGQRVNIWSVWDEMGNLKIQRNYTNSKQFQSILPKQNHPFEDLYTKYPDYQLSRNNEGYFPYQHIEERSVMYSNRIWRTISKQSDALLFEQVDFQKVAQQLLNDDIHFYFYGKLGDFVEEVPNHVQKTFKDSLQSWDFERVEIKEEFFISSDNSLGDFRPIALSFYRSKMDQQPSYTIYLPYSRTTLTKFKVGSSYFSEITHLDDVLFFHFYRGNITKVNNQPFFSTVEQEENANLEHLKAEHDWWLKLGR